VKYAVEPGPGEAVARVRQDGDGEIAFRNDHSARDVAKQTTGMAEPIPVTDRAADGAKAVGRRQGVVAFPLSAGHFATAV
jgi:hypothetical protein